MAVNKLKNEPTIRPTTPKCALEETALLVPVSGPLDLAASADSRSPFNLSAQAGKLSAQGRLCKRARVP